MTAQGKVSWSDSSGKVHDLTTEKRIRPHIAALRLNVTRTTIYRMIARRDLDPIVRHNPSRVEIFECVLADYIARHLTNIK